MTDMAFPPAKPSFGNRLFHLFIRLLMVLYTTVLRLVTWLGPRTRSPGSEGYEVLLTGTFYSQNWINAHLRPLAKSQRCARVWVVSTFKIDPVDKVVLVSPPAALVRWFGAVPARLLTFLWIGVRRRPHLVGGFHLLFNGMFALLLARLTGARSLYFCVGGEAEILDGGIASENRLFERLKTPDAVVERQLRRVTRQFDLIVTMGTRARSFFQANGNTGRIEVVSGGLDAHRFVPGRTSAEFDLVFVGRLAPIKRVDLFLECVRELRRDWPGIRAAVVGDGAVRASLEAFAGELGVADAVLFVGGQPDVVSWLQRSRVFVLTSDSESLSLSLIEAMLCGLPAVVSRVGDLPDLVQDGVNGFLVTERSGAAFAAGVSALLQEPARYRAMADAARLSAQRHELPNCVRRWDDILGEHAWSPPGRAVADRAPERPVAGRK
ncbi:MAG: glycosyltransferase [Gammaproteobacteria bacterium]|nr:glycosyltransferase [Gammaproteobacteria bacterium]